MYTVSITTTEDAAKAYEASLSLFFPATTCFETAPHSPEWEVSAYGEDKPDEQQLAIALRAAAISVDLPAPTITVEHLASRNWLEENQQAFPAFQVGQFYIYGSHVTDAPPPNTIPLQVDATVAFGTGEHASTKGCLLALTHVQDMGVTPKRALDIGTGTGILGMAALKIWPDCQVLATDIDEPSVAVAVANATLNNVSDHFQAATVNGYQPPIAGEYGLIFSNILARPLCDLAADMAKHLTPKGYNISAGLLTEQADMVINAYRQQGLTLINQFEVNEWTTLLVQGA